MGRASHLPVNSASSRMSALEAIEYHPHVELPASLATDDADLRGLGQLICITTCLLTSWMISALILPISS